MGRKKRFKDGSIVLVLVVGNFDVKNDPRTGQPIRRNVDEIIAKVRRGRPTPNLSRHDIAKELTMRHQTVLKHLRKAKLANRTNWY